MYSQKKQYQKKIYLEIPYQRGLSLVELMIAITLGLILTAGVLQLFVSNNQTFRTQQTVSRVQESGRLGLEFIASDIRMAGFTGFLSKLTTPGTPMRNRVAPVDFRTEYLNGISFIPAASAVGLSAKAGTNVLILRGAVEADGSKLTRAGQLNTFTVALTKTEAGACGGGISRFNGLCINDHAYVSDYARSTVFAISNLAVAGANLVISFTGGWGGDPLDLPNFFVEGAVISKARTNIYFIRDGASGQPSLFQQIDAEAPVELLEGVANISLFYNRRATPANYVDALNQLNGLWNDDANPILSVRLELLARSVADNVLDDEQAYRFNNTNSVATDKRLYKVFATTVALRNQLP